MAVVTRLTNTGTLLVNGSFDENTSIAPSQFRTTSTTVLAGTLDEVSLAAGSVQFTGASGQCLSSATDPAFNFAGDFTAECWFYSTSIVSGYATLITTAYTIDQQGFFFGTFDNQLCFLLGNGAWFYISAAYGTFSLNTWNHAAFTRSGSTYNLYLNGTRLFNLTNATALTFTNNRIAVGGRLGNQVQIGLMSQVRVVNGTALYTTASYTVPKVGILPSVTGTSLLLNNLSSTTFTQDNSPNRFTVTNNVSCIWNANGPFNQGSTTLEQRQVNDGTLEVSTQFDEFTGAPIVDSNLILWVDAAQPASYPGSGTSFFDLSGGSRNFTLGANVAFTQSQGGAMAISTSGVINSATSNMTIAGVHTVSVWVQPSIEDTAIRRYLTINTATDAIVIRNDGAVGAGNGQLHYYIDIGGSSQSIRVNNQVVAGQTANFVGTWNGTIMRLYKNGTQIGTFSVSGTLATSVNTNYRIASVTEGMVGDFYQAMVYNRALSAQEVLDNFNAIRGRYGV